MLFYHVPPCDGQQGGVGVGHETVHRDIPNCAKSPAIIAINIFSYAVAAHSLGGTYDTSTTKNSGGVSMKDARNIDWMRVKLTNTASFLPSSSSFPSVLVGPKEVDPRIDQRDCLKLIHLFGKCKCNVLGMRAAGTVPY
jgi:hypothetical protein